MKLVRSVHTLLNDVSPTSHSPEIKSPERGMWHFKAFFKEKLTLHCILDTEKIFLHLECQLIREIPFFAKNKHAKKTTTHCLTTNYLSLIRSTFMNMPNVIYYVHLFNSLLVVKTLCGCVVCCFK